MQITKQQSFFAHVIATILLAFFLLLFLIPNIVHGQTYTLINKIGAVEEVSGDARLYLTAVYWFLLNSIIVLAVIMTAIGGVQYVASGVSPSQKADAKSRITHAIGGLILALISYLILNTLNPNLINPSIINVQLVPTHFYVT